MPVYFDEHPSERRRLVMALAVLAVVAVVLWALWPSSEGGDALGPAEAPGAGNVSKAKANPKSPAGAGARQDGSLIEIDLLGTRLDASRLFQLGFGGGLNLDSETRATLDTLLVHTSSEPSPEDLQKLEQTLRQGLPKEEAERALKLFQGYRDYLADMTKEAGGLGIPETPQAVDDYFARLAQIQRRHFDHATATALFGQDMSNARLVLHAALVDQNQNLSPAQKKEQLDALRAQLPPDQRGLIAGPSAGAASEGG
jgi:hypothetical protein